MLFRFLPLVIGAYFAYAGAGSLALAVLGERVEATVDETVVKAVQSVPAAAGMATSYVMRTKVAYHFEVCPRPARSADAACVRAEGSDTMILRTAYSVPVHDRGYAVPVVFLRLAPRVNAVRQPRHLLVYGLLEMILGLAVVGFEVKVLLRERRDRPGAAGAAARPAAARS
jgi:hypothetical protein